MAKYELSKSLVEELPVQDTEYVAWDANLPGFGVRTKPSGNRSYVVQYRNRKSGLSRRKTLGQHGPLLTFDQAWKRARILLSEALKGNDPVVEERLVRVAPTVRDLAMDYMKEHAIPKKRAKSVANDQFMLDRFILPQLGGKKVSAVNGREVQALHGSLKKTPYQANRVLALLSKMFSLAMQWEWRNNNPVKGIQRYHEEPRDRWLPDDELNRLLAALLDHPNRRAATVLKFHLLTGARIGEVLSARWDDIDFDRGVWTKPSHHTKQKRKEHLPLSGPALALLSDMRSRSDPSEVYLFPGDMPEKSLQGIKRFWKRLRDQAGLQNYRIHDNRHTHASHLVSSGLSLEIVGKLLGHTNPLTTKRYAHLADSPLRAATERFGSKIDELERVTVTETANAQAKR